MNKICYLLGSFFLSLSGYASTWTLDNSASSLAFATVKASDIGESHRFTMLSGSVDRSGKIQVAIDLASIDTQIPIRDERMRDHLFQVTRFPTARLDTSINLEEIELLKPGGSRTVGIEGELTLGGTRLKLAFDVMVWRLTEQSVVVSTVQPVIVSSASLNLVEAVEKLREIAGLPSISKAVPVTFSLTFRSDR